ncbi:hypothetical protein Cfla_0065 [Cellulomonas flavigena DSM 20109]|uniref:Pyrrolo-quinoline quinone repeat domain-containing protein n=1 Tax=Cellulomonas flavigena (strain ATCC 482 / DSM 20109 / BCRC 11376 / JCM 18109 / NBRC 3775 / NCIMB 8073 / NRS 134) TaxID=446466 RepID=D5UFM6_CELFN|nr:PQQ-binding-like beta-propeller repeat protein [Cellulomonas flavigena]ADG72985.1 hypothetical protein Cfla_0065 [Cellulomonas flavigena DSM 20109]
MARDRARRDVELVEDDGSPAGAPPAGGPGRGDAHDGPGRTRRRAWVVGAALVAALVAAGAVAQGVVTSRERERIAAVAGRPGVVGLLDGPVRVLDERRDDTLLYDSAAASGGLVVAVQEQLDGREVARAVDPVTGTTAWETELVTGRGLTEVPGGEVLTSRGACRALGAGAAQVVCLADDAVSLVGRGTLTQQAPTTTRVVVLDARDGSVVTDLSDAAGEPLTSRALAVLDDLVVLAGTGGGEARVRALTADGTVAWDVAFPVTTTTAFGSTVELHVTTDAVALISSGPLRLLDATGTVRREVPLASADGVVGTAGDAVVVSTADGGTLLARPAGVERVPGAFLRPTVDAPAAPGLVLTAQDATLHAWRPDGTAVWSVEQRVTDGGAALLPGHVLVGSGTQVLALDAATGGELWRTSGLLPQSGLVTDGRHLLALAPLRDDSRPQVVAALDLADGDVAWRVELPAVVTGIRGFHGVLATYTFGASVSGRGPLVTVLG